MYVGIGWTFLCPGATMLCVCKWTERGQALRISQGPWDELQVFALDVESCWAGGGGAGGRELHSDILHILLLICYHLSSPEEKTFPVPSSSPLSQGPHLRFHGSTEGCL